MISRHTYEHVIKINTWVILLAIPSMKISPSACAACNILRTDNIVMRSTGFCCSRVYSRYVGTTKTCIYRYDIHWRTYTHSLYNNGPKHSVLGTSIGRFVNVNRIKDFWAFRTLGNSGVWKIANHSEKGHTAGLSGAMILPQ